MLTRVLRASSAHGFRVRCQSSLHYSLSHTINRIHPNNTSVSKSNEQAALPPTPPCTSLHSPRPFSTRVRHQKQKPRGSGRFLPTPNTGNKINFVSLGCPRNWVDTEVMLGIVLQAGYEPTQTIPDADYLVVNTCGFLKAARDESRGEIEGLIKSKKRGSKLIVTGCMINLHKDEILKEYPEIDHVLGAGSVDKVLTVLQNEQNKIIPRDTTTHNVEEEDVSEDVSLVDAVTKSSSSSSPRSYLENGDVPRFVATPKHYAYLKIAEGCRKRCSFCIIPKIKGPLRSKPEERIIQECQSLLSNGAKEIILIAQDLGDYGKDLQRKQNGIGLSSLLRNLLQTIQTQDFWLRLMYLYPDEITDDIITIIQNDTRICRYLDMPIQHINNDILKSMKRTTSSDDIRNTITNLRTKIPDIHIRTSLMVGFPGETEDQFQELLDFVKEGLLDNVGVFMYSDEELARSSKLVSHVSEDVKQDRYTRLMDAQHDVVMTRNKIRVDSKERMVVVLDGVEASEEDESEMLLVGRYYGQCPEIDGKVFINDIGSLEEMPMFGGRYNVEITGYDEYDLIGRIVA